MRPYKLAAETADVLNQHPIPFPCCAPALFCRLITNTYSLTTYTAELTSFAPNSTVHPFTFRRHRVAFLRV